MHDGSAGSATPPASAALGPWLLGAAMALPFVGCAGLAGFAGPARADSAPERGEVAIKVLEYQDRQPGASRIHVTAPSLGVQAPLSGDWLLGATLTADAISGASPAYHTAGLLPMHDHRRAMQIGLTRYLPLGSVTVGANVSSESDYLSRGMSLQLARDAEDKNTTWTLGVGANEDDVNPNNHLVDHERKHVLDLLAGVTRVLTVRDIVQLDLGYSRGSGYYSDPYKVFDQRPREHDHWSVLARWNHHVASAGASLRLSYRYYSDNWQVRSHTLSAEWVQPLANGWTVTPLLRLYTQSAASFYIDADPNIGPFPPNPPAGAVSYSEDQRLSAYGGRTWGIKLGKQLDADWRADLKLEDYGQRGSWRLGGSGSPNLAPFGAHIVQIGLARAF